LLLWAAYALLELANNLRLLMRKEAAIEEWLAVYCGHDREPLDIDRLLPVGGGRPWRGSLTGSAIVFQVGFARERLSRVSSRIYRGAAA
jgi:hypothetical protein